MKRRVSLLLALSLLPAAVLLLAWAFAGEARLQEPTAVIDPALLDALETEAEVEVVISLKPPDIPFGEWTTSEMRQNTAERQAGVLPVLTEADFTLIHQFEIVPALHGRITESGVQRLDSHPDVVGVSINFEVLGGLSQSVPLIHAHETRFIGTNGTGQDVAVLDTGIDTDHPDLSEETLSDQGLTDMV